MRNIIQKERQNILSEKVSYDKHKYLFWTIKYHACDYTKNIKNIYVYIVK